MILAAGLGTRMGSLSALCPKPALPVRGLPVISYALSLLQRHGVHEVIVNLHHLPETLITAIRSYAPDGMRVELSHERQPLGTGGAIRRAATFLRESDPALVLSGDMLLDLDLDGFVGRHRERGDLASLALIRDPRASVFGTLGVDEEGRLRRIGNRFDLRGETSGGLFTGVRAFAARAFDTLPQRDVFEDLRDWLAPRLAEGARDVRGELLGRSDCTWEPVGTPAEYLAVNLAPPSLSYLDARKVLERTGTRVEDGLVIGAGAHIEGGARLERCVVWARERVPANTRAADGVFAGGRFHPCPAPGEVDMEPAP